MAVEHGLKGTLWRFAFNFMELKMEKGVRKHIGQKLEAEAQEFISFIFAITEERLAASKTVPPAQPDTALAAAALAVQEAVKTFLAVSCIDE